MTEEEKKEEKKEEEKKKEERIDRTRLRQQKPCWFASLPIHEK